MPVQPCQIEGQPGRRWGEQGKCYACSQGGDCSRAEAQALEQGQAQHASAAKAERVRVRKGQGMTEGLVYVEAYLPFDPAAFHAFAAKMAQHGSAAKAAKADPELAEKALTPIDTDGEAMLQEDVIKLAHRFVTQSQKMDIMHDLTPDRGARVVQTFVNTPEIASPLWWPGAWVVVLKVEKGSEAWQRIESGELGAVSFQANVGKQPIAAVLEAA